ncbi:hypothetical protein A7Q09_07705 [Methylacidiphilum sp. Yel]|jgi:hypothetical protein|uniref:hypothetical protein n=1 Tax=Methylacidiphilum sp. Yel TaxID=1847730 RepID=UPI00106A5482|nr:hypothetical protein [Methylacidiphilum sp. Yel]TFE67983.1 hypothetical protein A7Q09_07705 [Methylacidiphilum sp. Yel]
MQSQPINPTDYLDNFRFKTIFPAYFDPGKFLHFFSGHPRLAKADLIIISEDMIQPFCQYTSIYPSLPCFFGVHTTVDRLSEKNLSFFENLSSSWHYSFIACTIINLAVIESCSHFLQNYFYFKNNRSNESSMVHPFSPLLGWCYYESTQFWFEDYAPIVGKRNAFVDDPATFNQQAKKIQEFFLPYNSLFSEEENPYYFITDNVTTLNFIESLYKNKEKSNALIPIELRNKSVSLDQ